MDLYLFLLIVYTTRSTLRTKLYSLYRLPKPSTQTYRHFQNDFLKTPLHIRSQTHPKNVYILPIEPCSIYTFICTAIHEQADSTFISLNYFWVDYPFDFDLLQLALHTSCRVFNLLLPKIAGFAPHTHFIGLPLHNSPPTQSS